MGEKRVEVGGSGCAGGWLEGRRTVERGARGGGGVKRSATAAIAAAAAGAAAAAAGTGTVAEHISTLYFPRNLQAARVT